MKSHDKALARMLGKGNAFKGENIEGKKKGKLRSGSAKPEKNYPHGKHDDD